VTETSKVVDVLLLLGRKQHSYAQGHMLCLHYTHCLMQLSVVSGHLEQGPLAFLMGRTLRWQKIGWPFS
jgi:hypothetical protein